ncbi:MAG: hypothetical protein AAF541_11295 [Pseudomonadota bacterium]
MTRRIKFTVLISVFVVLGLNYSWLHAAMVVGTADDHCESQILDQASARVVDLFGEQSSQPWIRCLDAPHLGLGKTIGTTNFAPGLPAIIILNRDGHNVDVIAHEWAHAELAERVGVLTRTYRLPTWFDEGLAMQVDFRADYGDVALAKMLLEAEAPELDQIDSPSTFYQSGVQGRVHYAWSRCVVSSLLEKEPLSSLIQKILAQQDPIGGCRLE